MNKTMFFMATIGILFVSGCSSENNISADFEIQDSTQESVGFVDCGISTSLNSDAHISEINFELDDALVCLGKSLLDGCKPAKAILHTSNGGQITYEIKNLEDRGCIIKSEYGDIEQIPEESQKKYANKFFECPVESEFTRSLGTSGPNKVPGYFAFRIYFAKAMDAMGPETKCTGSLVGMQ